MSITGQSRGDRPSLEELVSAEEVESQPAIEFDVEKEIGEEGWEVMKGRLNDNILSFEGSDGRLSGLVVSLQALNMNILYPERFSELDTERLWSALNEAFEKNCNEELWPQATMTAMRAKMMFPDRELDPQITYKWSKQFYDASCDSGLWFASMNRAIEFKILFPDKVAELDLESHWPEMKAEFERVCREKKLAKAAGYAVQLRVLFPEKYSELDVEKYWPMMKEEFHRINSDKEFLSPAVTLATNLKVLAAKEVRITDQGLELTMPDKEGYQQNIPDRPERVGA